MKFTLLLTDYFIYLLVLMGIVLVYYVMQKGRLRQKWRRVLYRPMTLFSVCVLGVYIVIGTLDTIHFENGRTISVLDKMLAPIAFNQEKTYSAPFATNSFEKENIQLESGEIIRDYPRLEYGGAHLSQGEARGQDIRHRLGYVLSQTVIIWLALSVCLVLFGCKKHQLSWEIFSRKIIIGQTLFPWRTLLFTLFLILFVVLFISHFMSYYHIFGTSKVGQDILYESLKSIRTGLTIGTLTTLVMLPFAILFGLMAGYFKWWVDDVIQYLYTTLSSIPGVLLIAAAVLSLQIMMDKHDEWFVTTMHRADARLFALCVILGITSWAGLCRLLRGETLKLAEIDYVQAARTLGVSHFAILIRHLLPNVFHIVLITMVLDFSMLVLAEAVLSYVGVGVDPSSFSWGTMINSARMEMAQIPMVWWTLTAAFIFMFTLVLAANIFSDAVRDVFDPRAH